MKKEYEVLFTPAKIGTCEIKNRFVMCPMATTGMIEAGPKGIAYNEKVHDLLVERAQDGVGLIIPGAINVYNLMTHRWMYNDPDITKCFESVAKDVEEMHSYGSKVFFQLSVGTGKAFPLPKQIYDNYDKLNPMMNLDLTLASSDEGLPNRWIPECKTKQLTTNDIHDIVYAMGELAYICKCNGIDGIDVHAVHEGYLMDQFATKYTNHRTDEYGGSLENRLRFACEIVKAIKARCGDDYPVILRYSVTSRARGFGKGIIPADTTSTEVGRDMEESKKAIQILTEAGYDGFNADNGTYDSWYYPHPPVYMPLNCNLKESIEIKPYTDKPIICAGRMQLDEAAKAINNGQLDFVGIARQFLADEKYLTKVYNDQEEDIIPCISCHLGCMPIGVWKDSGCVMGKMGSCALNPHTGNEQRLAVKKTENPKHIAVIGGGVAGMELAIQADRRGHTVDLYEKSNRLGGVFNEAAAFTFKEKDRDLLTYYSHQIEKSNVNVHMNTAITDLNELDADEIVIATGASSARQLKIPGAEKTISALDFLKQDMPCDDKVAIIGGGLTGCEIAYELAQAGKHPYIVEMMDDILMIPGSSMANTSYLRDAFEYYQVPVLTAANVVSINENTITVENAEGKQEIPYDQVVTSIGYLNGNPFTQEEEDHIHIIGDCKKVSNLCEAILQANELVVTF